MRGWIRSGALAFAFVALTQGIPGDRGDPSLRQSLKDHAAQSAAPLDIQAVGHVVTESQHAGVPNLYALELATTVDAEGKPLFSSETITQLHKHDVPTATAITLNAICDAGGNRILDTDGITALVSLDGIAGFTNFWNREEGKRYAASFDGLQDIAGRPLLTSWDIYRSSVLGLSRTDLADFIDTGLPNALVVMPRSDYNGAFLRDFHRHLLERIRNAYDCRIVFADSEYQVHAAIWDVPEIELLLLSGHGSSCSLTLSSGKGEMRSIDCDDDEFRKPLRNLRPGATVILYSCWTGNGGKKGKNLANTIRAMAPSVEVIAPTTLLSGVNLEGRFPDQLMLTNGVGEDITYRAH